MLTSSPTGIYKHPQGAFWGCVALGAELLNRILFYTCGPIVFNTGNEIHRVAAALFFVGWLAGFVGGGLAIAGLFKDRRKWVSALALFLSPFLVIVTV